jgi:hypothetical protein
LTVPAGTKVVARPGQGPSMAVWFPGEVTAHQGALHQVTTRAGDYWCEVDDLLPASEEREPALAHGVRVWALWLDGRWYPGTVDGCQGSLRHVRWDDGDRMWLPAGHAVVLAAEPDGPQVGQVVMAPHWNGEVQPARVEQEEDQRFRVVFADGEESWVSGDELQTFPPNPFLSD